MISCTCCFSFLAKKTFLKSFSWFYTLGFARCAQPACFYTLSFLSHVSVFFCLKGCRVNKVCFLAVSCCDDDDACAVVLVADNSHHCSEKAADGRWQTHHVLQQRRDPLMWPNQKHSCKTKLPRTFILDLKVCICAFVSEQKPTCCSSGSGGRCLLCERPNQTHPLPTCVGIT